MLCCGMSFLDTPTVCNTILPEERARAAKDRKIPVPKLHIQMLVESSLCRRI